MEKTTIGEKQKLFKGVSKHFYTEKYYFKDDGIFPNNTLPVIVYRRILNLPRIFPSRFVMRLFHSNNWSNAIETGVYHYHHYHSNTHEVLGIIRGKTRLKIGGENGTEISLQKSDVIIIPAGVAHKNLEEEEAILCVGAYPEGVDYDMNYGNTVERPKADETISSVPIPLSDPVLGLSGGINQWWN
jgi:uncharacterized protein YjlB